MFEAHLVSVDSAVLLHGLMRGVAALFLSDGGPADMRTVRRTCHEWIASALSSSHRRARIRWRSPNSEEGPRCVVGLETTE